MLKELFLLDPHVIFLNHGSFGACPRPVFEAYQAWQRRLEQQPVRFLGVELDDLLHRSRETLAGYVHAPVSHIVYVTNATQGVNIVARSLQLNPGDEILTSDQEYGACLYTWGFICQKSGSILRQQPLSLPVQAKEELVDQLWQGVTPRTRLIFISHIASSTSLSMPVQAICERARAAGILTLVDGAHAPGQLDLDIAAIQPDFYVGNCHKWMLSPKGAGFLYARPEVQHLVEPLVVSWGYESGRTSPKESAFIDFLQWRGTYDPAAALAVPDAITFMQANQWQRVRESCHRLLREVMEQISSLTGLTPLYSPASEFFHQMGTVPIPRMLDINELKQRLYEQYRIEIPCIEWNGQHFLRISVQGYNTAQDLDALVVALKDLLPELCA